MPVFIDEPAGEVTGLTFRIAGWVAVAERDCPVSLAVNDRPLTFVRIARPDLRQMLPQFAACCGIFRQLNVAALVLADGAGPCRSLSIRLRAGTDEVVREVAIAPGLHGLIEAQHAIRSETRAWANDHLRCPSCGSADGALAHKENAVVCSLCRTVYAQDGAGAIDMRTPAVRQTVLSDRSDNISSNPYEVIAQAIVDRTTADGGWVLDCGAGSRPFRTRHVLNVEIEDYFSTDVLAAGDALPFDDNVFDAAISLAVLEHVRDPFACAQELLRVVKPGCEIVCSVPFLQPVHGFPSHYYNMTREGLKNLFRDGYVVDCVTPLNGHPILTLQWFLTEYLRGLPEGERAKFGSMTLSEAAGLQFPETFAAGYVTSLSSEAVRTIASLNTVIVRKKPAG